MRTVARKRISLDEQETSFSLSPVDKDMFVYSCVPGMIKKIYQYAEKYPDQCRIDNDDGYGVCCYVPVDWLTFRPKKKRVMTDEQKAAARERLMNLRQKHDA